MLSTIVMQNMIPNLPHFIGPDRSLMTLHWCVKSSSNSASPDFTLTRPTLYQYAEFLPLQVARRSPLLSTASGKDSLNERCISSPVNFSIFNASDSYQGVW